MVLTVFLFLIPMAICLEIQELRVPDMVDVLGNATMSCKFTLHGDRLFSVKWYKDDLEFFRFMPGSQPLFQFFPVKGVQLVEEKCNETVVSLDRLEYATSGTYRCEVSTEAPHFKTDLRQSNMTVLGLPKEDPWIQGVASTYSVGDYVTANCTSSPSYPAAVLTWFINHEKAEDWLLIEYPLPVSRHYLRLESRSLGLRFQADNSHFLRREGVLTLTCTAAVMGVTRRRVTVSHLAKLNSEKFAQERFRNTGAGVYAPLIHQLIGLYAVLWTIWRHLL